jgi:adenosylhomocysteine nucleosidase
MSELTPERRFVALVAALSVETRPLNAPPMDPAIEVFQSGPGPAASRAAALEAAGAGAGGLVSWGLAGGLAPGAATGSVIISADCRNPAGSDLKGSGEWVEEVTAILPKTLSVQVGPLLSSDEVLRDPAAKAAAWRSSHAMAVDTETFAMATVAQAYGLPWIAVRVVADCATDTLPLGVEGCVDKAGRTRVSGVLRLLWHPGQWSALATTADRFRVARRSLEMVTAALKAGGFAPPRSAIEPSTPASGQI